MDRIKEAVLNLSLFYKALIANSIIIAIGGGVAILVARNFVAPSTTSEATVYILAAVGVSVLANYLVLRVAFIPIQELKETVDSYLEGNVQARAQRTMLGAPQVNDLADILNVVLDQLQDYTTDLDAKNAQLQRLSAQVITAQEEERKRLARELHDETGQMLTSLVVGFKMLENAKSMEEVSERVASLKALTSQTLEDVRAMAYRLRPAALDDLGLIPALRSHIKEIEHSSDTKYLFRTIGFRNRLPSEIETVLYRTVQEALTNVQRHAGASRVSVLLEQSKNRIVASVEDNGTGFNVNQATSHRHNGSGLGLFGIGERVSLVGGSVEIQSELGKGTVVRVSIPLNPDWTSNGQQDQIILSR